MILFDHGTPAPLRHHLREHSVDGSVERGWWVTVQRRATQPWARRGARRLTGNTRMAIHGQMKRAGWRSSLWGRFASVRSGLRIDVREYRPRLIADVITCKLDVREVAARQPQTETTRWRGAAN